MEKHNIGQRKIITKTLGVFVEKHTKIMAKTLPDVICSCGET